MSVYGALLKALERVSTDRTLRIVLQDADGNVIGDIPLSTLQRTRVYEQTFEDGTTDTTVNNATQVVQTSEVYAGTYALQVTIAAGNTGYVQTPRRPVSPGQKVTFSFAHKEDSNIIDIKLVVVWMRANGNVISTEEFTLTATTSWQVDTRTVTAPNNAAYMALRMLATAGASDGNVYLDDMFVDLVGQIFRVDGEGQIKVTDSAILDALTEVVENHETGLDETSPQSITLDTKGHKLLEVYAKATTATTFYLDVSPDNSTWIEGYMTWSSVTEVKETLWNGFRYVRLRSAAAGSAGDTVDLYLSAK